MSDYFELNDGEEVLLEDKATTLGRWTFMGKGGKLILTNKRLLFTDKKNGSIKDSHDLKNILSATKSNRLMVIPFILSIPVFLIALGPFGPILSAIFLVITLIFKSVRITSKGRDPVRYGVKKSPQWVSMIEEQLKAAA